MQKNEAVFHEARRRVARLNGKIAECSSLTRLTSRDWRDDAMRSLSSRLTRYEGALAGCRSTVLSTDFSRELADLDDLFGFIRQSLPPVIAGDLSVLDLNELEADLDKRLAEYD